MPEKSRGSVSARFSGVVLARQRRAEAGRAARRAPRGRRGRTPSSAGAAGHEVQRGALLRAGLGEDERPVLEVEGRERRRVPPTLRGLLLPVQPARDHEVQDQEALALEREDDPLADPREPDDAAAFRLLERRRDRAQQERTAQAHRHEALADDPRLERREVRQDVRQLRHGASLARRI